MSILGFGAKKVSEEEYKKVVKQLEETLKEIYEMEKCYNESIRTLKKEIDKNNNVIDNLKTEILSQKNQYEDAQKILTQKDKDFHELEMENISNIHKIKTLKIEKSAIVDKIQAMNQDLAELETKYSALHEKNKDKRKMIKSLNKDKGCLEEKIEALKKKKSTLKKTLKEVKEKLNECEEEKIFFIKNSVTSLNKTVISQSNQTETTDLNIDLYEKQKDSPTREGSFGSVCKVKHIKTNKIYAVKTFTHISSLNKIQMEVNLWERLQKLPGKPSSIPNFYGSCEKDSGLNVISIHLLFDYFPCSLKNLLDDYKSKKSHVALNQIVLYSKQLINGLCFLQTMKICHRDLKPANLLLDESLNIFIIDLGESKEIIYDCPEDTKKELTVTGSLKYFSPELDEAFYKQKDTAHFNPFKSDVFSFGLILLELGILEVPKKDNDVEIWENFIKEAVEKFDKFYKGLVKDAKEAEQLEILVQIIRKCLRTNPKNRPDFLDLYYKFQQKFRIIDHGVLRTQIIIGEKS